MVLAARPGLRQLKYTLEGDINMLSTRTRSASGQKKTLQMGGKAVDKQKGGKLTTREA